MKRITTSLKGLDKYLSGGFPEKAVILLSGSPGTGKTLLSLNYLLEGARRGERCCLVTLNESKEEIIREAQTIDSMKDIEKHIPKTLAIEYIDLNGSFKLGDFVNLIEKYPELDRISIDNLNKLLIFSKDEKDYRIQLSRLIKILKKKARSILLLAETVDGGLDSGNSEAFECDGVIKISFLELEEKVQRLLKIYKMRYTDFEPLLGRHLVIDKKGIRIGKGYTV